MAIENERTGTIASDHADAAAIELNVIARDGVDNAQLSSLVENWGLINGVNAAISGGDGHESIINHGRIVGDVVLGDGSDMFVFGEGGNLSGDLFLGAGDDLVRIEKGSGTAHIADFGAGATGGDVIDLSAYFSGIGDVMAHSSQHGNDVVINLGHKDQLVLEQLNLSALNAGDFIFA
jgi:hypothetical protein